MNARRDRRLSAMLEPLTAGAERPMKIIVIEDDAVVSDTIALYLQDGFEVASARDGVTGLQLASAPDTRLVAAGTRRPRLHRGP